MPVIRSGPHTRNTMLRRRVLMLVSMAANYIAFASGEDDEQGLMDPVAEVLSAS